MSNGLLSLHILSSSLLPKITRSLSTTSLFSLQNLYCFYTKANPRKEQLELTCISLCEAFLVENTEIMLMPVVCLTIKMVMSGLRLRVRARLHSDWAETATTTFMIMIGLLHDLTHIISCLSNSSSSIYSSSTVLHSVINHFLINLSSNFRKCFFSVFLTVLRFFPRKYCELNNTFSFLFAMPWR